MAWLSRLLNVPEFGFMMSRQGQSIVVLILGHILCLLIPYFLGSLNFGIIISKIKFNDDIRRHGSGNAGMTNMLRTYGKSAAAMTFLGDALKAFVSVFIGMLLLGETGTYLSALGVIFGHVYPAFYKFKGGKGVVCAIITILFIQPVIALIVILIFVLTVALTKYISLGSVIGAAFYPMLVYALSPEHDMKVVYAFIIGVFIIWLHRANIKRLHEGTENKLSFGKGGKK
ncbi:MAG: glycerol-3-phosphate 1-O-acyltransferase PlsY [Clostridia bacterium]|nr:glycerol-3-phosphate 1-O-acyltransferase PlsY [Clostridia bacterium]